MYKKALQDISLRDVFKNVMSALEDVTRDIRVGSPIFRVLSYHIDAPFKAVLISKSSDRFYQLSFLKHGRKLEGDVQITAKQAYTGEQIASELEFPSLPVLDNLLQIGPLDTFQVVSLVKAAVMRNYACEAATMQSDLLSDALSRQPIPEKGPDYSAFDL